MYNVRVKKYLNTEQIQIFSEPMQSDFDVMEWRYNKGRIDYNGNVLPRNVDIETGEVYSLQYHELDEPMFGQKFVKIMHDNDLENLNRSVRRTKSKIYDVAKCNEWHWFFTLTFNPDKVDSYDYESTTKKLSVWLMNMRKKCSNMKYIVVPEQHASGRWHFHGLFSNVEDMVFVDSEKRDKKGRIIYNVGSYKLGYSTATQIEDMERACSYIVKYVSKELCAVTKGHKRYWCSRNVELPVVEEYFISYGNEELLRILDIGYQKKCKNEFTDVTYLELPIYTTNTQAFFTSDTE